MPSFHNAKNTTLSEFSDNCFLEMLPKLNCHVITKAADVIIDVRINKISNYFLLGNQSYISIITPTLLPIHMCSLYDQGNHLKVNGCSVSYLLLPHISKLTYTTYTPKYWSNILQKYPNEPFGLPDNIRFRALSRINVTVLIYFLKCFKSHYDQLTKAFTVLMKGKLLVLNQLIFFLIMALQVFISTDCSGKVIRSSKCVNYIWLNQFITRQEFNEVEM